MIVLDHLVEQCRRYYNDVNEPNAAGGSLHIVLDDGNLEDSDVNFCLQWAKEHGDAPGERLASLILSVSLLTREKLYERYNDYAWGAPDNTTVDLIRRRQK